MHVPPSRYSHSVVANCRFSVDVCAVLRWVIINYEHSRSRVCSVCLPLFAAKADLFLMTVRSSLSYTRSVTRHRGHPQAGSSTCGCLSPATSRAILTLVSVCILSRGLVRRQVANQCVAWGDIGLIVAYRTEAEQGVGVIYWRPFRKGSTGPGLSNSNIADRVPPSRIGDIVAVVVRLTYTPASLLLGKYWIRGYGFVPPYA